MNYFYLNLFKKSDFISELGNHNFFLLIVLKFVIENCMFRLFILLHLSGQLFFLKSLTTHFFPCKMLSFFFLLKFGHIITCLKIYFKLSKRNEIHLINHTTICAPSGILINVHLIKMELKHINSSRHFLQSKQIIHLVSNAYY